MHFERDQSFELIQSVVPHLEQSAVSC